MQVLHFEHCTNISLVCSLFQELTEWEIHFPTGGCCAADVLRALSLVLSFMPGQKESTKKNGVALQLWLSMTFTALLQPYCMSVKAQTKRVCEGYQVYFLLLVEEETRRPS